MPINMLPSSDNWAQLVCINSQGECQYLFCLWKAVPPMSVVALQAVILYTKMHVQKLIRSPPCAQAICRKVTPWRHGQILDEGLEDRNTSMSENLSKDETQLLDGANSSTASSQQGGIGARHSSLGSRHGSMGYTSRAPSIIVAPRHSRAPHARVNSSETELPAVEEHRDTADSEEEYDYEQAHAPLSRANSWRESK